MVIGIDIDETITNTHDEALKYINKYAPSLKCYKYDDINNPEVYDFLCEHIENIQSNLTIKENVKEAIDLLKEAGFKIVLITARGGKINYNYEAVTEKVLKKYDIKYDEIYYKNYEKGKIAKELGVKYFIDDKESILDNVNLYDINCIRYGRKDNKSKYLTFDNWLDIASYIISDYNGKNCN